MGVGGGGPAMIPDTNWHWEHSLAAIVFYFVFFFFFFFLLTLVSNFLGLSTSQGTKFNFLLSSQTHF